MNAPRLFRLHMGWLVMILMLLCLCGSALASDAGTLSGAVLSDGQPLEGALARLWAADGSAAAEQTTGQDGSFSLSAPAGSYTFTLLPPEGYAVVDFNGEAADTSGEFHTNVTLTAGEAQRAGFVLESAATLMGIAPSGAGQSVTLVSLYTSAAADTREDGSFTFTHLPAGDYSVYMPLPSGKAPEEGSPWQLTPQGDLLWINVTLAQGETLSLPTASLMDSMLVFGSAFVDYNNNAEMDADEPRMTGVPIALERREADEWIAVGEAVTDQYGEYSFLSLTAGEYRVVCTLGMQSYYASSVGGSRTAQNGNLYSAAFIPTQSTEVNIGLGPAAQLTVSAYVDANANGERGAYERALPGVTVEALSEGGSLCSGVTDADGNLVMNVPSGRAVLRVSMPSGYGITVPSAGAGSSVCVETIDVSQDGSAAMVVAGQPAGLLSGRAFEDVNNNGVMDEGEPGVAGVMVHLSGKKTSLTRDVITDEDGNYCFELLPDGVYVISATLPEGMLYARYSTSGGDLRSIFSGATLEREFTVRGASQVVSKHIGVIQRGVIRGTAFLDANYNGIYDEGEPPYPGVTVEVTRTNNNEVLGKATSDANGVYTIENLRGGDYRVRAVLPADGSIFSVTAAGDPSAANQFAQRGSRRDYTYETVAILSGGEADVVVGVARGATISGVVFQDENYNGHLDSNEKRLPGIKVYIVDEKGNVVASDTTQAKGLYTFSGIMPGRYTVQVQRKSGCGFTRLRPEQKGGSHVAQLVGDLGVTASMDIAMAQSVTDVNAGMLPAATISGQFFHDLNDDGLFSEGEIGMVNATVRLLSEDGEVDLTSAVDAKGGYFFDGVMPGKYTITYQLPERCEMARVTSGGNTVEPNGQNTVTEKFTVTMGEAHTMPLAGAVTLGSFEGYAFRDTNGNGAPDEGEARLAGAMVELRMGGETFEAISETDGSFLFDDLRPGSYQLKISLPEGFILTDSLKGAGLTLGAKREDTLSCPWSVLTSREEMRIGAAQPSSISGEIWLDENQSGERSPEEMIMAGVPVELIDEATGGVVQRTTSTDEGFAFNEVRPATYTARITLPAQSSPAADRTSNFIGEGNYLLCRGLTVGEGETIDGLSTGIVSTTSIGGKLYLDVNGARSAVTGVAVRLMKAGESVPLQAAITDSEGSYRFDGLWPDDYCLEADLPDGTLFVRPSDPNYPAGESVITSTTDGAGRSDAFSLQMARHQLNRNIILIQTARVGDLVWLDSNRNGLVDEGEPMIPGVTISLTQDGQTVYQTQSNAYGYYYFDDVYPGEYMLEARAYPELFPTMPVPQLRLISSCLTAGDGSIAYSDSFTVASGTSNLNYDLGYILLDGQSMPAAIVDPPTRDWSKSNSTQEQ